MILDGLMVSKKRNKILKDKIEKLNYKRPPHLAIILIGNDPASLVYVKNKIKKGNEIGIKVSLYHFNENDKENIITKKITSLNKDKNTDGIIIQLPVPKKFNKEKLLDLVIPEKDVDGFSLYHQGLLFQGRSKMIPATPKGILSLLNHYKINLEGLNTLVIGRSLIVGRPTALVLINENATVTLASKHTKNLKDHTKKADLIISATGVPKLITQDMVKKDAILIDVGFSRINKKVVGDLDFNNLVKIAKYITPVPKGVGPMTINALFENTFISFCKNCNIKGE